MLTTVLANIRVGTVKSPPVLSNGTVTNPSPSLTIISNTVTCGTMGGREGREGREGGKGGREGGGRKEDGRGSGGGGGKRGGGREGGREQRRRGKCHKLQTVVALVCGCECEGQGVVLTHII